jgi:hypothetical protein
MWALLALLLVMPLHATRRALIIGIGAYPDVTGWGKINGDKDVALVEDMLVSRGFPRSNIVKLTNEQATANGIKSALEQLVQASETNDFVYIHFSGHGQRITDTNGDEPGGYDEAWIPYDAHLTYKEGSGFFRKEGGYQGQNHLVDDELNEYLHRLRQRVGKKGKIIVVADACHSGGGTRAMDDDDEEEAVVVRGTSDDFIIPSPAKEAGVGGHNLEWIFISACKSTQSNYEYHGAGSLTYAILQLSDQFDNMTCVDLQKRLRSIMRDIIPYVQTPAVEAPNPDAKFF